LTVSNQCLACGGLRPRGSRLFSLSEQTDLAFCSVQSISLPDTYFEAQSLHLYAYRLLSSCLRLVPSVAIRHSRLAASGSLRLSRWGSHPLSDTPLSWRTDADGNTIVTLHHQHNLKSALKFRAPHFTPIS